MTGASARLAAQAKVNLALRVLAREASGYHQLETLFCRVELADDVVVRTDARGRSLDVAGEAVPAGGLGPAEDNLAWRAATRFSEASGWPTGFAIEIEKRIPVGGGLGGGSADAGAVLRILQALAPRPLAPSDLFGIAASLGADVPFLASPAPLALGWGRGDRLLALPALPQRDIVLLVPSFGVATADAYRWLAAARGDAVASAALLDIDALGSWAGVSALAANDFEGPVFARHPELAALRAALGAAGARVALLAGSGSTVFGVFDAVADGGALAALPVRAVRTRTSARVVEVERSE